MIDDRINDRLTSGGGRTVTHERIGDVIKGVVLGAEYRQQRDMVTGQPKTFDDGSPMEQLVITLQTDLREDADDDGARRRYLKWEEEKALGNVLRTKKVRLEVGGTFASKWTGEAPAKVGRKKLYEVDYVAPVTQPSSGLI